MTQEALSSLQALGEQLRMRLLELPEYRALTVIDRTIQELSQILNEPTAASPDQPGAPAKMEERSISSFALASAAPRRAETALRAPGSSQGRMAAAIAQTIAARTGSPTAPPAPTPRFSHPLSAAS